LALSSALTLSLTLSLSLTLTLTPSGAIFLEEKGERRVLASAPRRGRSL
jgi:hypothetical protein